MNQGFVPATLYGPIFFNVTFMLSVVVSLKYMLSSNCNKLLKQNSSFWTLILSFVVIFYIGSRPVSYVFADMVTYYKGYVQPKTSFDPSKGHSEWFFEWFTSFCRSRGFSAMLYFLSISVIYFFTQFLACKKLLQENTWMAMMFVLSAFSCYTYSTNGLRNGMACGMVSYALAIAFVDKKYLWSGIICFLAIGIHRTMLLPIAAAIAAIYIIKKVRHAVLLWISSIAFSLVAGSSFESFFASLGFDDRMNSYFGSNLAQEITYVKTYFRWDFLLYSAMPVLLAWYISIKRGIKDEVFDKLAITYILANAFWALVIRAPYSNRFAYLSWFLYPFILAYGVIRIPIWKDQDRKAGLILLLHAGFTFFMYLIGKQNC